MAELVVQSLVQSFNNGYLVLHTGHVHFFTNFLETDGLVVETDGLVVETDFWSVLFV